MKKHVTKNNSSQTAHQASCQTPCALPEKNELIQLDHGGGGQLGHTLFQRVILPRFANQALSRQHDSASLDLSDHRIAFTTDSYVVDPLIFPGGDIGKLAVYGTVNDLLMTGARPQYLSCSFIIEEGLPIHTLTQIIDSMASAAEETGVTVVTGDTKVVDKGHGDGLYINTSGIGLRMWSNAIAPQSIQPGDQIILSSDIGRHGLAIMAQREGLRFDSPILSDCASLLPAVSALMDHGINVHCMRDATRGGLASILVELAEASGHSLCISQECIPVSDVVTGACEILGLDPLYVANEGCFVVIVPAEHAHQAIDALRQHAISRQSIIIGSITTDNSANKSTGENTREGKVLLRTEIGSTRVLRRLTGQLLPRIC
ncbi:MAG: hydrogenase expression/formation protein HypE [Gammaproteobacteria bacterium]